MATPMFKALLSTNCTLPWVLKSAKLSALISSCARAVPMLPNVRMLKSPVVMLTSRRVSASSS